MENTCSKCAPFNGLFQETPSGLRRCDCPTGLALKAADDARKMGPRQDVRPVISAANASLAVKALSAMPYFPANNEAACTMVADAIMGMCTEAAQPMWLVRRILNLYRRWPGVAEVRMVFASRFTPLDGVYPSGGSEIYPDGIPAEARAAPAMKALPPGATVSADHKLENAVRLLARSKSLDRPRRLAAPRVPETPTNAAYRPVTAADVARAEAEHKAKVRERENAAAREEAGL